MAVNLSIKHLQADQANKMVIVSIAIAVAICVFSFFMMRGLLLRRSHHQKVINAKETAVKQLKENIEATDQVVVSYKAFTGSLTNVLGGNSDPNATGPKDGDNARLILDALPSKYDFPALVSSIEKIAVDNGYKIESITGTDDEIAQSGVTSQSDPQPVEMPITFTVSAAYEKTAEMLKLLERSIRPFKVTSMEIQGNDSELQLIVKAVTYYQPEKSLSLDKKVVQ